MENYNLNVSLTEQKVNAYTAQTGPRGVGIKSISQDRNTIIITYEDGRKDHIAFPDWWFGTRAEYNAMSVSDRMNYYICFIEEGS